MSCRTRTIGRSSDASDRRPCPLTYSVTRSFVCSMPTTCVEVAAVDGQPAERAGDDDCAAPPVERRRRVDASEPRARHHQLARGAQAEPQRAMQPHLFLRLQQSAVAALRDQQLDLLRRVDVAVAGRRHAQQPQHAATPLPFRTSIAQEKIRSDHCIGSTVNSAVRVGILQRQRFRHELADDHREHGQDEQHENRGGRLGGVRRPARRPAEQRARAPGASVAWP